MHTCSRMCRTLPSSHNPLANWRRIANCDGPLTFAIRNSSLSPDSTGSDCPAELFVQTTEAFLHALDVVLDIFLNDDRGSVQTAAFERHDLKNFLPADSQVPKLLDK